MCAALAFLSAQRLHKHSVCLCGLPGVSAVRGHYSCRCSVAPALCSCFADGSPGSSVRPPQCTHTPHSLHGSAVPLTHAHTHTHHTSNKHQQTLKQTQAHTHTYMHQHVLIGYAYKKQTYSRPILDEERPETKIILTQ